MKDIIIKHSSIVVNDYEWNDCTKLQFYFSIYNITTHKYVYKAIEYIEETKTLILPRGVDIYLIESLLRRRAIIDKICDPYDFTGEILIKYFPKDDVQKEALRFVLGKEEYEYTETKSQLCVNLSTGKGKTYITIAAISYLMIKSIIVCPTIGVVNQWKEKIQEYTDILAKDICVIDSKYKIIKIIKGIINPKKYKIFLCTHSTLNSYASAESWSEITKLFQMIRVGMKIYDEAHLFFDNICKIDAYTNTKKTLYLTATPARSDESENSIYKLCYKNVPSIDLFDQDEDPKTKYIAIHFNSHPSPMDISKCKNKYGLNKSAYIDYLSTNDYFYMLLHVIMNRIVLKLNGKVLLYIGTNRVIDIVKNWLEREYPEISHSIGVYTSTTSKETKEEQLNQKYIISTTKSCGAAMDIPYLKCSVVLAEPFKSEVLARQSLGRTGRNGNQSLDNTLYIDIVDEGFYFLKKYYAYKQNTFYKYAKSCNSIYIKTDELEREAMEIMERREQYKSYPLLFSKSKHIVPFMITPFRIIK